MPDEIIRLTRKQVREYDRRAIEDYHIPGIVLMENAARGVADVAIQHLKDDPYDNTDTVILCGSGNNGGDGLAIARLLHIAGINVTIALTDDPGRFRGDALTNWRIVEAMELPVKSLSQFSLMHDACQPRLIIDAIYGTGLSERPRNAELLERQVGEISVICADVIAVDVPSGVDCDTGEPLGPCLSATKTVTFVAQKAGFANPKSREFTGEVIVADIGAPRELLAKVREP